MEYSRSAHATAPALLLTILIPLGAVSTAFAAPPAGQAIPARPTSDAYKPVPALNPLVIPRPKEMRVIGSPLRLGKDSRLVLAAEAGPEARRAAELIRSEIKARFGLELKLTTGGLPYSPELRSRSLALVTAAASAAEAPAPPRWPEGYALVVEPERVLIAGNDAAGIFWGAQTLIQLLAADERGPFVRGVRIDDWPTLTLRGAHLFHGKEALPFHEKLIDRVFARFKLNTLFLQVEQARWNHDPTVAPEWAGTPEQIREEIAYARERGITVYPLVQGYGHMEWLLGKGENRKYAEDPETPYALNFSDPAAVAYLEGFIAEADDLFGARAFHVGLDEVTMRGKFPLRSQPKTWSDLFIGAATHWHDFLKKRGKRMFMWADQTIAPDEAKPSFGTAPSAAEAARVRAALPKDIILIDWQYTARNEYPSLKLLKDAGFSDVVAATWNDPAGIQNFSRIAADAGALGAIQTTWAGYESRESVLEGPERKQFPLFVLAAEYFWNGGEGPKPEALPYRPTAVFGAQWQGASPADYKTRPGVRYDLASLGTAPLPDWLDAGAASSPEGLPTGKSVRLDDGTEYQMTSRTVLLAGRHNGAAQAAPKEVVIPLGGKPRLRELRFVLAASHRVAVGTAIGRITVALADGTSENIDLVYGSNIAAADDDTALENAPIVWMGKTRANTPFLLRRLTWKASGDARAEVASVTFTSAETEAAPALFALTGLTE